MTFYYNCKLQDICVHAMRDFGASSTAPAILNIGTIES